MEQAASCSPPMPSRARALGERGDIIKRLHRSMGRGGREVDPSAFVLEGESAGPVLGRLAARGLDDELKGSAYAVVEGVDGRAHHIKLAGPRRGR
jgi:type IV secretory pathway VirD2 relaxase